ncbi:MAG: undecaprenyl/decaprenyl-phosphate alpha-N-acetylglucosaminyl 1-phosphate transferase, partial [Sphingobacteriales bacterium]
MKHLLEFEIIYYIAIFTMAFVIVLVSTPTIMWTAIRHQLFDRSDLHRKTHKRNISNLGGVAIFCSFTLTVLLFSSIFNYQQPIFLIIGSIILFATGLKDDVYGIGSGTKLLLSIAVASILVFLGGFRLTSLYGVLNIGEINIVTGALFSILLIIFLNNAFNLIDGLDGLAGTIGIIVNLTFGIMFAYAGQTASAFIAFSLVGATAGFLYYNYAPARIF